MTKTTITRQMAARGSFGIAAINERTGVPKAGTEHVINVWHVKVDGRHIGTFATREKAREAARRCVAED